MPLDLIIRNARLPRRATTTDIGIANGTFARIAPDLQERASTEIDADGRLVSPPLVDSHVHLDAVLTVGQPRYNATGTLIEGIQIWSERKQTLAHEDVKRRATEAIKWEVAQGTLFIRSHVDVCDPQLTALRALLEVQQEVRDICELQLVAFPQDGILSFPSGKDLMDEAMRLGANVVGGIPHYEWTREMGVEDVHYAFELARRYNRDVDCHCDETDDPHSRFTEVMAADTLAQGWQGRATVSHCTAMHSWDNAYAFKMIGLLARGRMNVICNPYDNSILQGRFDTYPKRRGIARVKELLQASVNVSLGHDSIMDPWYPLGRGDMLAAASLALHLAQMSGHDEIATMYDLITTNAAKTLNIAERYGIEEGKPANLIVVDAADAHDALRLVPARLHVIKDGRVVASTTPSQSRLLREGNEETVRFTVEQDKAGA
ncbi:MAG TPA: cytosine deaminase [Ktedonobacterales bacterium]|nr:cytosine deaminase [Ktedonobacterales bacterium]